MFAEYLKKLSMAMLVVNAWCAYGMGIFEAAKKGDVENLVRILNENPLTVSLTTGSRSTPLHIGAKCGHMAVVRVLLCCGADVNANGMDGITPLHEAIVAQHLPMVILLVQYGANVNAREMECEVFYDCCSERPYTALEKAIDKGNFEIAQFLIRHGAEVHGAQDYAIAAKWHRYFYHTDKEAFHQARKESFMNIFSLSEDIATLILAIEGVVPLRASEAEVMSDTADA